MRALIYIFNSFAVNFCGADNKERGFGNANLKIYC